MGSLRVAATPGSVRVVRDVLRDDLTVLPELLREEVALVATELLGNAVRHARALDDGQIAVAWGVGEYGVEIAVTDGGSVTTPELQVADLTDAQGRGLAIVSTLSMRWGVEHEGAETTVWAVVPFKDHAHSEIPQ